MNTLLKKLFLVFLVISAIESRSFYKQSRKVRHIRRRHITRIKNLSKVETDSTELPYEIQYWDAKVDNFDYDNKDTFKQRVLYSDKHYKTGGPIFFYPGNEDSITDIWGTVKYMTEVLAPQYGALLIFVEHRYFGTSLPYGYPFSLDPSKNRYLSSEQALFDYARYLQEFKENNPSFLDAKVIVMGTSYGGMLAAWARIKYPHVFDGAIANSAPILLFQGPRDVQYKFAEIATSSFAQYSENCVDIIRSAFKVLGDALTNPTQAKFDLIEKTQTNSCTPVNNLVNLENYINSVESNLETTAQWNYPPHLPVKSACALIENSTSQTDEEVLTSLNTINAYLNNGYLNQGNCTYINPVPILDGVSSPWDYMACTEMIFPIATNGVTDMFNYSPWNNTENTIQCQQVWNADVRPNQEFNYYGGRYYLKDFETASNIFFANGIFDPWNSGCPQKAPNDQIIVEFSISAHGEGLANNPDDDPTVLVVREHINQAVGKWISQ